MKPVNIIETKALTKCYHGIPAVNKISLQVPEGSVYGFLGPNGAGKSTAMKLLLGLAKKDSGSIRLFGEELTPSSRISILKQTGSLIESPSYYGNLTGYENLQITCMLKGLPESEILKALKTVRMEGQMNKKAAQYSLGMKQRLAIANALLGSPRLLLLDEPTNGLDPAGIHEMRELIRSLPKAAGMTVLISSHLLPEMEQMADHVGILSRGSLVFQGPLSALRKKAGRQLIIRTGDDRRFLELFSGGNGPGGIPASSPDSGPGSSIPGLPPSISALRPALTEKGLAFPLLSDRETGLLTACLVNMEIPIYRVQEEVQSLETIYLDMVKEAGL